MSEVLKQRSTAWRMMRCGSITASRFKDVLTKPREKGREWSATADAYLLEKLSELITCRPADNFTSAPTRWGTEWEVEAFKRAIPVIEERFGMKLDLPEGKFAFVEHPDHAYIGASVDGVCGDTGLLEIKAPYRSDIHLKTVLSGEMPEGHTPQVQGGMWATGRKWYAFCSFDPRVQASGMDPLFIVKVARDDNYINNELAPKILAFRDRLMSEYHRLVPNKAPF